MGYRKRTENTKDEWRTPPDVFKKISEMYGPFTLDAAASDDNHHCDRYFTAEIDALQRIWTGTVFVNPPYGKYINLFVRKAHEECIIKGNCERAVLLIPASTDTAYWHECVFPDATEIEFWKGRIRFLNNDGEQVGDANFPSAVVIFDRSAD